MITRRVDIKVTGVQKTMKEVNRLLKNVKHRTIGGLLEAADYVYWDMQVTYPTVPEDSGALNESWYSKPWKGSTRVQPVVEAGFDKEYATWVHERVYGAPWGQGAVGIVNWQRVNSGPKFLELALKRNKAEIVRITAEYIGKPLKIK